MSALSDTDEVSRFEPVPMVAPSRASSSLIWSEVRLAVPSSSMFMARAAVPGRAVWSEAKPASIMSENSTTGTVWRSARTIFRPLESEDRSTAGKLAWGAGPTAGGALRSAPVLAAAKAG